MTYADLLAFLITLSKGELAKPVTVYVASQTLAVLRIDEDGNAPVLSAGVHWVEMSVGAE